MDASYKIQRGIHVHLIQFFMCPEFWVHIIFDLDFLSFWQMTSEKKGDMTDDKGLRCEFRNENFHEKSRDGKETKGCGLWLLRSGIGEDKGGKQSIGTGKTSVIFCDKSGKEAEFWPGKDIWL